jgi:CheY-like chemotaxis protein
VKRPRLLIADDDPILLRVLAMQFEHEGYEVCTAVSGTEALASIRVDRPDAVILDGMMPDLGGVEACRLVRSDPDLAGVTVLVLTAYPGLEEPAYAAGADGFVGKPYDLRSLSARVRELVALRPAELPRRA